MQPSPHACSRRRPAASGIGVRCAKRSVVPPRRLRAGLLVLVAACGLGALPLLHAESHAAAQEQAKAEAARTAFALAFLQHRSAAQERELRRATALAFGSGEEEEAPQAPPLHAHDGAPKHTHGGLVHGEGALEHLGLAIAPVAPPPPLPAPASVDAPLAAPAAQAPRAANYLVPRFAQGPPACA
jgi:hypothetical protein